MAKRNTQQHEPSPSQWCVVLAGGEGTRLSSLTRALYGFPLPKQFADLGTGRSLLQEAIQRADALVGAKKTVVVLHRSHKKLAQSQLRAHPGLWFLVQPKNAGTGTAITWAVAEIMQRDPNATITFLPADHHVRDEETFSKELKALACRTHEGITLVGVKASTADTEMGWIVPEQDNFFVSSSDNARIDFFVEKPSKMAAAALLAQGAYWNTLVMMGRVASFAAAIKRSHPGHWGALLWASARSEWSKRKSLHDAYNILDKFDFSNEVLEKHSSLRLARVRDCGWSDMGTPNRVMAALRGTPAFDRLLSRIAIGPRGPQSAERALFADANSRLGQYFPQGLKRFGPV